MNIALLGCGVVGGGVLEIAEKRADMSVRYVLVRRDKPELGEKAVNDINVILNDDEVDTVVEVMGGLLPAYEYVRAALRAGKNVVTANKHLVAHYYKELVELAEEHGAAFRCTPAVGGGIPWLVNLERVKRLDSVKSFCGIMNGTTNFILDAMHTDGSDFAEVLAQAQELGYAEADPSADIDGLDIQRKAVVSVYTFCEGKLIGCEEVVIPCCDRCIVDACGGYRWEGPCYNGMLYEEVEEYNEDNSLVFL